MKNKIRQIPWDKVISFHKEIASRAEESFFSLNIDDEADRWSSIEGNIVNNLSGPWKIYKNNIKNKSIERNIKQSNINELFLGGPCWFKWNKSFSNKFIGKWQPLLYKEVKIKILHNGSYEIIPDQGGWEISPLIYNLLDFKGVVPIKPLDELILEIIEKAEGISQYENLDLGQTIFKILTSYIPELKEDLMKEFPKRGNMEKPSDWIIFTQPSSYSAITQNLMSDYNSLQSILMRDNTRIGGLNLLNDINNKVVRGEVKDILPIVPLNDSQYKSVKSMLGNKPVTVISGPPGCGKSQVVLSTILNAWANGTSVLFASNNNQAVDVIRKRLEDFEVDFPIAVRAGAKKVSNLEETLRRTINILANQDYYISDVILLKEKQDDIIHEKRQIEALIDSKIPERIDQSIKSAINAYGNYLKLQDEYQYYLNEINKKGKTLGYNGSVNNYESEVILPLRSWITDLDNYKEIIEETKIKTEKLELKINDLTESRNSILLKIGVKEKDFDKAINNKEINQLEELKNWNKRFVDVFSRPIENYILDIDWKIDYNQWSSVREVDNWRNLAKDCPSAIEKFFINERQRIHILKDIKNKLKNAEITLISKGINEDIDISYILLRDWLANYKTLSTLTKKTTDFLPWSTKNKLIKNLKAQEQDIISKLPLTTCNLIGTLNEEGRKNLSLVIDALLKKYEINEQWLTKEKELLQLEENFASIKNTLIDLDFSEIPSVLEEDSWVSLINDIKEKYSIACNAEIVLGEKEKLEETIAILMKLANDFKIISLSSSIKDIWFNGYGKEFNEAMCGFMSYVEKEDIIFLRQLSYDGAITNLIEYWQESIELQNNIELKVSELDEYDTVDEILQEWFEKRPTQIKFDRKSINYIPNFEDESWAIINKCENYLKECIEFTEEIQSKLLKEISNELCWAKDKILDTLDIIDDKDKKKSIKISLNKIFDVNGYWDIKEIIKLFSNYNLDILNATINNYNTRIEEISFEIAKTNKVESLSSDVDLQDTLEDLLRLYLRNHGKITNSGHSLFENALRAIPVWITTAQSPQAIPMKEGIFDLLIIDEATQCTLTNILPLIYRAKRIAVIGDPEQLTSISTISEAAEDTLAKKFDISEWIDIVGHASNNVYKTTVRCLPRRNKDIVLLNEHYRSHPLIIGFSNINVYQSNLTLRKNFNNNDTHMQVSGVYGVNVKGISERGNNDRSWRNLKEAKEVCELIKSIKQDIKLKNYSIGVVTPFKAQVEVISEMLDNSIGLIGITVDTVHRYQGDERDIMIFSTVIGNGISEGAIRWVESPPNLINVAVTRAKEALFVVGDIEQCTKQNGILGQLAKYVETVQLLRKTSEFELKLFSLLILQGLNPEVHVNIGDIEVDFVLENKKKGLKLVIEVDGSQHEKAKVEDSSRDAFLSARGYNVLRFTTREISEISSEVINKIFVALQLNDKILDNSVSDKSSTQISKKEDEVSNENNNSINYSLLIDDDEFFGFEEFDVEFSPN